jgi:hypothetical protein
VTLGISGSNLKNWINELSTQSEPIFVPLPQSSSKTYEPINKPTQTECHFPNGIKIMINNEHFNKETIALLFDLNQVSEL